VDDLTKTFIIPSISINLDLAEREDQKRFPISDNEDSCCNNDGANKEAGFIQLDVDNGRGKEFYHAIEGSGPKNTELINASEEILHILTKVVDMNCEMTAMSCIFTDV